MSVNRFYEPFFIGTLGLGMSLGLVACRNRSGLDSPESQIKAIKSLKPVLYQKTDALSEVVLQTNAQQQYNEALYLKSVNEAFCEQAKLNCVYPEGEVSFGTMIYTLKRNMNEALNSFSINDDPSTLNARRENLLTLTLTLSDEAVRQSTALTRPGL